VPDAESMQMEEYGQGHAEKRRASVEDTSYSLAVQRYAWHCVRMSEEITFCTNGVMI
jgi:hypothetical protein